MAQEFDGEVYDEEVDYPGEYDEDEEHDGMVEEVDGDSDVADEEIDAEADDEEDQDGKAGAGAGRNQMLYIPGIGYIPLSSLGNIPGLTLGGGGGGGRPGPAPIPDGEREWKGLSEMPSVTQETISDLAGVLREDEKSELTMLILGKGGVGKSSTLNSLFNERAANVATFQPDNPKPVVFSRKSASNDFVLTIIDTPSLLDQDAVSEARLEAIARVIKDREIDVVLYLDRLDGYATDSIDHAVIEGITRALGPSIWLNTVLCFTRASESSAPAGVDFEDHVATREAQLKAAVKDAAGTDAADLSVALVENSSRCPVNADGEKVVPGDVPWIADVLEKAVDIALNVAPYEYRPSVIAKAADPNRRRKWLIPLVLAAQVGFKLLMDRVMDDDGCKGDTNGPFDARTVKERREELREEREKAARRQKAKKAKAAAAVAPTAQEDDGQGMFAAGDVFGADDIDEEDDEWLD